MEVESGISSVERGILRKRGESPGRERHLRVEREESQGTD